MATQPTVYAISAYDMGGIASVMMEATHCGEQVRTDARWKCQAARNSPNAYCPGPPGARSRPSHFVFRFFIHDLFSYGAFGWERGWLNRPFRRVSAR